MPPAASRRGGAGAGTPPPASQAGHGARADLRCHTNSRDVTPCGPGWRETISQVATKSRGISRGTLGLCGRSGIARIRARDVEQHGGDLELA